MEKIKAVKEILDPEMLKDMMQGALNPLALLEALLEKPLHEQLEIKLFKSKDKEGKEWITIMLRRKETPAKQ